MLTISLCPSNSIIKSANIFFAKSSEIMKNTQNSHVLYPIKEWFFMVLLWGCSDGDRFD